MNRALILVAFALLASGGSAPMAWSATQPDAPRAVAIKPGSVQNFQSRAKDATGSFVVTWTPAMTNTVPRTPWAHHIFAINPKFCSFEGASPPNKGFWSRYYAQGPYAVKVTCSKCGYNYNATIYSDSQDSRVKNSNPATISGIQLPCPQ